MTLTGPDVEFAHSIVRTSKTLRRTVRIGDREFVSQLPCVSRDGPAEGDWWLQVLQGAKPRLVEGTPSRDVVRTADLFCGSGGFSWGVRQAADALGVETEIAFACDTDVDALATYEANHHPAVVNAGSVMDIIDAQIHERDGRWHFYYEPEVVEPTLRRFVGAVDLVIAGPPCQGHSNLNNHTRREDPRNALYPMAAAVAVGLGVNAVLIENVPAVLHDRYRSVDVTRALMDDIGWRTDDAVLSASRMGWPQTRKRHFFAARQSSGPLALKSVEDALVSPTRSVGWAIGDLLDDDAIGFLNQPARLSEENAARIQLLFENDLYTLPNHARPLKHRDGHTYPSSYGRMNWDEPAGTITTGFMTPGRGRFIHPLRPRALTPHEAARIQGFADTYFFGSEADPPARGLLAKWIGDAVPLPLGYAAGFSVLAGFV